MAILNTYSWWNQGRRRNIFQRGKVIFRDFFLGLKCFFPVQNSHLGRPTTNFSGFEIRIQWYSRFAFPIDVVYYCAQTTSESICSNCRVILSTLNGTSHLRWNQLLHGAWVVLEELWFQVSLMCVSKFARKKLLMPKWINIHKLCNIDTDLILCYLSCAQ